MKKNNQPFLYFGLIVFLLVLSSVNLFAQADNIFVFRDQINNQNTKITSLGLGDEGSIYVTAKNTIMHENYLIKLSDVGNIIWQKKIPTVIYSEVNFTSSTTYNQTKHHNNHIYIVGSIHQPNLQNFLLKIDENGALVWYKTLNPADTSAYDAPSLEISSNNKIIVSSSSFSSIDIFCLNENGSVNWTKNFNTDTIEWKNPNFDICVTENGDIIGCAKAENDISLYKLGADGNPKWARRLVEPWGSGYTHVKSILEINSNKFLVCGYRDAYPSSGGFYGFIDSTGNFTDFRILDRLYVIKNGIILNNNNILLSATDTNGINNHYIEIETNGTIVSGYYANPNYYIGSIHNPYNLMVQGNSTLYIGVLNTVQKLTNFGTFSCFPHSSANYTSVTEDFSSTPISNHLLLHTPGTINDGSSFDLESSNLILLTGCSELMGLDEISKNTNIKFYPTLLHNTESIYVDYEKEESLQYQIMDLNGKMMSTHQLLDNSITINELSSGMYLLRLISNDKVVATTKFVVTP